MMKAWGRNGYFKVHKTEVVLTAGGRTSWVEVFSKREGKRAPLLITGDTKDVLQWVRRLERKIKAEQEREQVRESEEKWYNRKGI